MQPDPSLVHPSAGPVSAQELHQMKPPPANGQGVAGNGGNVDARASTSVNRRLNLDKDPIADNGVIRMTIIKLIMLLRDKWNNLFSGSKLKVCS